MCKKEDKFIDQKKAKEYKEKRVKNEEYCHKKGIRPYEDKRTIMYSISYVEEETNTDRATISRCENGKEAFSEKLDNYYQKMPILYKQLEECKLDSQINNDKTIDKNVQIVKKEDYLVNEVSNISNIDDAQEKKDVIRKDNHNGNQCNSFLKNIVLDLLRRIIFLTAVLLIVLACSLIIVKGVERKYCCALFVIFYLFGIFVEYMELTFRWFVFPPKKNAQSSKI